jgi:lysozyme
MMIKRTPIRALFAGAVLIVSVAGYESYVQDAMIPIPGDVPTKGFGTTRNADGSPVKLGDTTTPVRALGDLLRDVNHSSEGIKRCIKAPLFQHEFDAYSSLAYNVGVGAVCQSSIPAKLDAGEYGAACRTILDFNGQCVARDKAGKCVKKKIIQGLVNRREAEFKQCAGEAA